jgi:parallel beta-helix repeat protein
VYNEVAGVVLPVRGVRIVGNTIAPVDGSVDHNSASAGGIMLLRAVDFIVSGNTIARTLADGIHITSGSNEGKVFGNTVRETGDDMIAVVSYAATGLAALNTAADLRANYYERVNSGLVQNVLISGNNLAGQYWGRGISVVGGRSITIDKNVIDNTPIGAAILLARETSYQTFGTRNIRVTNNLITRNQVSRSPYDPDGTFSTKPRTGHGAIEVHASLFDDEVADSYVRTELAVRDIAFVNNSVKTSAVNALRVGVASAGVVTATRPDGSTATRSIVTGDVVNVDAGASTGVTGSTMACY